MSYVLQAHVFKTCALTTRPQLWPFICSVLLVRCRNVPHVCQFKPYKVISIPYIVPLKPVVFSLSWNKPFQFIRSFILACSGMWGLFTSSAEREFHSSAWEKKGRWMIPWGNISICINESECQSLRQEVLMTCLNWSSGPKSRLHLHWNSTHNKDLHNPWKKNIST